MKHALMLMGLALAFAGCSSSAAPAGSTDVPSPLGAPNAPATPGLRVVQVDGYPLDRSLSGLVAYSKLDAALVLSDLEFGQPGWTTADGSAPAYVEEGRAPDVAEGRADDVIVTPVTGTITAVLRGEAFGVGDRLTFDVAGGQVGGVLFDVSDEISPSMDALASADRILIAGEVRGTSVIPAFLYRMDAADTLRSLLTSASTKPAVFKISELVRSLAARP